MPGYREHARRPIEPDTTFDRTLVTGKPPTTLTLLRLAAAYGRVGQQFRRPPTEKLACAEIDRLAQVAGVLGR